LDMNNMRAATGRMAGPSAEAGLRGNQARTYSRRVSRRSGPAAMAAKILAKAAEKPLPFPKSLG
jgi:hypothetical protein